MRKIGFTILSLLLVTGFAQAQNRSVTGVVTDEKGNAVEGVNVQVIGTRLGTTIEVGQYRLYNVPANATLRFSGSGIITKDVNAGVVGPVNTTVVKTNDMCNYPITIQAQGITRRQPKELGYAASAMVRTNTNMHLYDHAKRYPGFIITGIVTDSKGNPLEGVSVRTVSTHASTGTDSLGRYRIYAASDTLVFETDDVWPLKEPIKNRQIIDITMAVPEGKVYEDLRKLRNENNAAASRRKAYTPRF